MSKTNKASKATKVVEQKTTALATTGLIGMSETALSLSLKVDIDTIVSIKVAAYERELTTGINTTRKSIEDLEKEKKELSSQINKEQKKVAVDHFKAFTDRFKAFAIEFTDFLPEEFEVSVEINKGDNKDKFEGRLIHNFNRYSNKRVTKTFENTATMVENHNRIKVIEEQIPLQQASLNQMRSQLANVGQAERQIKAKIATHKLNQTDDGKALLEQIMSTDLNCIKLST